MPLKSKGRRALQHDGFSGASVNTQPIDAKLLNRFISRVNFTGNHWLWAGALDRGGYGRFDFNGKTRRAHRVAYFLFNEDVPADCHVLHTCDNPACVRPDHLRLGTHRQNMADMVRKGRSAAGVRAGRKAKLTLEDVGEIRRLVAQGAVKRQVAGLYGISDTQVINIVRGRQWRQAA